MKIRTLISVTAAVFLTVPVMTMADHHKSNKENANIIETARAAGQFGTLLTAIEAAGLTDALAGEGPFTVFAPTDAAFAEVPADQLEALLADTEALAAVLTYHVVSGKVGSAQVVELDSAETLQGSSVDIATDNGQVRIDGANIVMVDIEASNGIIHVIDAVITP